MKRINSKLLRKWIEENGKHEAIARLMTETGVSASTIEKLARGKYPAEPNMLLRKALAETTRLNVDELFPEVGAKGKAS